MFVLARATYALVIVAVGTLVGGFFTENSNVLLFVSIGLSVAAIVLVLVGWARRAREAPVGAEGEPGLEDDEEEGLLEGLDDEELAFVEERRRGGRRGARSKARPRASKPKAKPKAKPRSRAKPRSTSAAKKRAKRASSKPSSARKTKPKATGKGATRPKRKPRRPPAE